MGEGVYLRVYGDPILREKAREFKGSLKEIKQLISDMTKIMRQYKGVGLSAPQIGILKRVIIADTGEGLLSIVNPEILERDREKELASEGCLSFPGVTLEIKRARHVTVAGLNSKGEEIQLNLSNLLARVIQHEIDHLDGILIIDRVSKKKLKPVKGRLTEIKEGKLKWETK
jgi:peptide deformylase